VIESAVKCRECQNGNVVRNLTTHWTEARVSLPFIRETRMLDALCARPVNSGVMSPLRIQSMEPPAAPQLNDVELMWIMREAGSMSMIV
jgi:hypothetical protein